MKNHLQGSGVPRMRPNPECDSKRKKGKIKNFGVFYLEKEILKSDLIGNKPVCIRSKVLEVKK